MKPQLLSTWCALRCREEPFHRFLGVSNENQAAERVRTVCHIKSRSEIDTDPEAKQIFHDLIRHPYMAFTEKEENNV